MHEDVPTVISATLVAAEMHDIVWCGQSLSHHQGRRNPEEDPRIAVVSGPDVANNYLAWFYTNDGFFLNKGVDPFPFDNALQMEVVGTAVPEPSTWAMMLLGLAASALLGIAKRRSPAPHKSVAHGELPPCGWYA
jgi:PEP-CTERM motif